jgi:hypothetical protein
MKVSVNCKLPVAFAKMPVPPVTVHGIAALPGTGGSASKVMEAPFASVNVADSKGI